jgi:GSH-dependent disulfide-bond oxidoreductase
MIQVYGMTSPNVVKVYIALEACGFDYQVTMVNVYDGEQHTPEFRALNPNGKVPIVVDPDGPDGKSITLFESGAILLYLNEKSGGKLAPKDPAGYWRAVTWLFQQHGGLGPMGGQLAHFYRFAPPGLDPYAEQRYRSENNRLYDLYDGELAQRPFIAGDTFTFADIAIWPWIVYHPFHGLDLKRRTHLNDWFERVGEIEAVKRGVAVHGPPLARPKVHDLDPDAMDRFFNRGRYTYT